MATRAQIIEQVRRKLAGGDPMWDFKIDKREIALVVDQVRDSVVTAKLYQSIQGEDKEVDGSFLVSYEVSVLQDGNRFYSELPAKLLVLPREREIQQVRLVEDLQNPFIPIKITEIPLYNGSVLGGKYCYYRRGERIYYYNVPVVGFTCKVELIAIPQGGDIPEADQYINSDLEPALLEGVYKILFPEMAKQEDLFNNGVSN